MSDLFLRACRGETVERPPVWIMRQAGRVLPGYRRLRRRVGFLELCKTPELAAEVTIEPVDALGVDAAIVFADILLPLEAMGAELEFSDGSGPRFPHPVRDRTGIGRLTRDDPAGALGYVYAALERVRRELDGRVPVIGFGGTPWTLATYLVEGSGSKRFAHLLGWSWRDPDGLAELLARIAEVSLAYLSAQIDAGAQAIQLFDTWGGLLSAERWRELARPPLLRVLAGLGRHPRPVPLIYYLRGGAHLLDELAGLPVEVLSVDWRQPLPAVRRAIGPHKVLQGNLDPAALLAPPPVIERLTRELLAAGGGGGHVVNLGHGILPTTPVEHARVFVRTVQQAGRA